MPDTNPKNDDDRHHAAEGPRIDRFEEKAVRALRRWMAASAFSTIDSEKTWVIALSGGPDSMSLLHVVVRRFPQRRLILAHMNHHARAGAETDEQFVRQVAANLGLPLEVGHWRAAREGHFETDARRARHGWLAEVAARHEASAILTAHTRDDQAETILMRLARGTGPQGLTGIRPWRRLPCGRTDLVRPLLRLSKQEVLSYLGALQIAYRLDPSNDDVDHQTRAWVRRILIPLLENRLNPRINKKLADLASIQLEEQSGLEAWVRRRSSQVIAIEHGTNEATVDLTAFRRFGPPWMRRRLLRQLWAELQWHQRDMAMHQWRRLDRWLVRQDAHELESTLRLPAFVTVRKRHGIARLRMESSKTEIVSPKDVVLDEPVPFDWPGRVSLEDATIRAELMPRVPDLDEILAIDPSRNAVMDASRIDFPLHLRRPRPGDRFAPLGLGGHHQKIVDFLRIQGVEHGRKSSVWLLSDQSGVIWVVGHRIADRVKVTSDTRSSWMIHWEGV